MPDLPRRTILGASAAGAAIAPLTAFRKAPAREALGGSGFVTPEQFGAVGDGETDDGDALEAMFTSRRFGSPDSGGQTIHLPEGKVYGTTRAFNMCSNTYVFGAGTIKLIAERPSNDTGGLLLFKNHIRNFIWDGPTLDINGYVNVNGFAIGDVPSTTEFVQEIYINGIVKGARIDTDLEATMEQMMAGGGKGITVQFRVKDVYANVRAEDCDIACSIESAVSDGLGNSRHLENVVIDLQAVNSHRTALFVMGSKDPTVSSEDAGRYLHSILPGCKVRLRAQGGQDAPVPDPATGIVGTNYDHQGVVTLAYASGVDIELYATTVERCTLIRGNASNSRIKVTNALMDELEDAWDTRPMAGYKQPGTYNVGNVFEANIHANTHHGVLVRTRRDGANLVIQGSRFDVDAWCQNGVGQPTQSDGRTDQFGASCAYRFRDMTANPIKEIVGTSSHNAVPQWSLAPSGGRVSVERASWHNGISEVAVFDNTDGWQFNWMAYSEAPIVFGSGGTKRKWLHLDPDDYTLRVAATVPGGASVGAVIATQIARPVADGDTTPTVFGGTSVLVTRNTSPTTITDLENGFSSQNVIIRFGDDNTTVAHSSSIILHGGASRNFATDNTLALVLLDGVWFEVGANDGALSATATLDFGSVAGQSFADLTIIVAGAGAGDAVAIGVPTAAVTSGIVYTAWVSSEETVTVRAHNYTGDTVVLGPGSFKAAVIR